MALALAISGLNAQTLSATQSIITGRGNNTLLVLGDSWAARFYSTGATSIAYSDIGAVSWAQSIHKQKLSIISPEAALGGTTSGDWANSRLTTYLTNYTPGWIICFLGINDIAQDVALSTIQANLQAVYDRCLATGAKLIICNVGPFGSTYVVSGSSLAVKTAQRSLLNAWISSYVASRSNCWLIDQYALLVDPNNTSGYLRTEYNDTDGTSGLHTTASGSRVIGQAIAEIFNAVGVTDSSLHAAGYVDSYDYDVAAKNRISNPMFLGSGGSTNVGAGTTITATTIAQSWTVNTAAGGTSTTVCTTGARTLAADGDTIGQNQILSITNTNSNDVISLRTGSISTRFSVGDIVEAEMFVRISGATNLTGVRLLMNSIQNGVTYTSAGMSYVNAGVNYSQADNVIAVKTPPLTIATAPLTGHILTLDARFGGAGGATLYVGRASWRKLN